MAMNPETTVKKVFHLPKELWERISDYRFRHRINSEAETIRRLVSIAIELDYEQERIRRFIAALEADIHLSREGSPNTDEDGLMQRLFELRAHLSHLEDLIFRAG